jgi:hypothetical protein
MTTYAKPVYYVCSYTGTSQSTGGTDAFGQRVLPVLSQSSPATYYAFTNQVNGGDLPGFREVIKGGGNAMNSVHAQRYRQESTIFSAKCRRWTNPFWHAEGTFLDTIYGKVRVDTPSLPGYSSIATNRAQSSFVKRANSEVTPFQGGVFLGELRETIETIRHPLMGIRGLLTSHLELLKKRRSSFGRRGTPRDLNKAVASKLAYLRDQWLETSYAIKPLVSDVESGARALAKIASRHQSTTPIRGYGRDESAILTSTNGNFLTQGLLSVEYIRFIQDISESHFYGALLVEGNQTNFNLDALGLNVDQFLPTLWELIPYSFVADYFANVGNIVEAASFNTARLKYWGSSNKASRHYVSGIIGDRTNTHDPSYIESSVSAGKTEAFVEVFDRVEFPSLVPSLEFKIPTYASIWTNLAALGAQHRGLTPY